MAEVEAQKLAKQEAMQRAVAERQRHEEEERKRHEEQRDVGRADEPKERRKVRQPRQRRREVVLDLLEQRRVRLDTLCAAEAEDLHGDGEVADREDQPEAARHETPCEEGREHVLLMCAFFKSATATRRARCVVRLELVVVGEAVVWSRSRRAGA